MGRERVGECPESARPGGGFRRGPQAFFESSITLNGTSGNVITTNRNGGEGEKKEAAKHLQAGGKYQY